LQPVIKDQIEALTKAVGGPIYTPNEGRQKVGLPPTKDGNTMNPAPNMTRDDSKTPKGKEE